MVPLTCRTGRLAGGGSIEEFMGFNIGAFGFDKGKGAEGAETGVAIPDAGTDAGAAPVVVSSHFLHSLQ
tara:strand:+ start:781 stop:987 length:207 start_codon:yes stop_codon:yes gene_type:complete